MIVQNITWSMASFAVAGYGPIEPQEATQFWQRKRHGAPQDVDSMDKMFPSKGFNHESIGFLSPAEKQRGYHRGLFSVSIIGLEIGGDH